MQVESLGGSFYEDCKVNPKVDKYAPQDKCKQVWERTENLIRWKKLYSFFNITYSILSM